LLKGVEEKRQEDSHGRSINSLEGTLLENLFVMQDILLEFLVQSLIFNACMISKEEEVNPDSS
jgi:hypothetical protein